MSSSELPNALGDAVVCKRFSLEQVVARVVGGNPIRDGIDVEPNLLAGAPSFAILRRVGVQSIHAGTFTRA